MTYGLTRVGICPRCNQPEFLFVHSNGETMEFCLRCIQHTLYQIDEPTPTTEDFPFVSIFPTCAGCLKPEYATKVSNSTLTTDEAFDLKVGETEVTTAILCKAYALRYTMYKYNRSISTGSIGGESDRDSVKNLDFLDKMFPAFWSEGWGSMSEYITSLPNIGGPLDPYSTFNFAIVKNENLDGAVSSLDDDEVTSTIDTSDVNYIEWG